MKVDTLYSWFVALKKGVLTEEQIRNAAQLFKKTRYYTIKKFMEQLPDEEREEFEKFLINFDLVNTKSTPEKTVNRINSIERHQKLIHDGVDIPLETYLELTNNIIENQVKLNKMLRPKYQLRVYIHKIVTQETEEEVL